jgi:hypothetical protein
MRRNDCWTTPWIASTCYLLDALGQGLRCTILLSSNMQCLGCISVSAAITSADYSCSLHRAHITSLRFSCLRPLVLDVTPLLGHRAAPLNLKHSPPPPIAWTIALTIAAFISANLLAERHVASSSSVGERKQEACCASSCTRLNKELCSVLFCASLKAGGQAYPLCAGSKCARGDPLLPAISKCLSCLAE